MLSNNDPDNDFPELDDGIIAMWLIIIMAIAILGALVYYFY